MSFKNSEFLVYILTAIFVFFGAAVHATNQLRIAKKNKETFSIFDWMILFPTAAFSGLIFGLLSKLLSDNDLHLMLAASIGAFLGLAGLNKIADIVVQMLTKGTKENESSNNASDRDY